MGHPLIFVLGAIFCFMFDGVYTAVELSDDMKEMAKMLHDQCVDESGVNGGLIEPCSRGDFANDGNLKCYFKCIFANMGALSDDGELDAEAFESILPPDLHDPLSKMINNCKDAKGADACEVAFNFNKCLYETDPAYANGIIVKMEMNDITSHMTHPQPFWHIKKSKIFSMHKNYVKTQESGQGSKIE